MILKCSATFTIKIYTTGITIRVNIVEKIKPPRTANPIDCLLSAPAPWAITKGKLPKIIAMLVIRIGLNLIFAASVTASVRFNPFLLALFAHSTISIEFLVTSPIKSIIPIALYRLSVCDEISNVINAPNSASGTARSIVKGWIKLSNKAANIRYIKIIAMKNIKYIENEASANSLEIPASVNENPGGSDSLRIGLTESRTFPSALPATRFPLIVTERWRSKWFICAGAISGETLIIPSKIRRT